MRSIALRTTDDNGNLAPWYHTQDDIPERVDADALTRATDFVVALARLIDRDAGRVSRSASGEEHRRGGDPLGTVAGGR